MLVKPLQNKKVQKKFEVPKKKSSLFPYKRTSFFLGTPNFFGPSYFDSALVVGYGFRIQIGKNYCDLEICRKS